MENKEHEAILTSVSEQVDLQERRRVSVKSPLPDNQGPSLDDLIGREEMFSSVNFGILPLCTIAYLLLALGLEMSGLAALIASYGVPTVLVYLGPVMLAIHLGIVMSTETTKHWGRVGRIQFANIAVNARERADVLAAAIKAINDKLPGILPIVAGHIDPMKDMQANREMNAFIHNGKIHIYAPPKKVQADTEPTD